MYVDQKLTIIILEIVCHGDRMFVTVAEKPRAKLSECIFPLKHNFWWFIAIRTLFVTLPFPRAGSTLHLCTCVDRFVDLVSSGRIGYETAFEIKKDFLADTFSLGLFAFLYETNMSFCEHTLLTQSAVRCVACVFGTACHTPTTHSASPDDRARAIFLENYFVVSKT